jgi:hypothetical protein
MVTWPDLADLAARAAHPSVRFVREPLATTGLAGQGQPTARAFSNSPTPGLRAELYIGADGRGSGGGRSGWKSLFISSLWRVARVSCSHVF